MNKYTLTATMNMEAESRESLVEQLETCKRGLVDDSGIAWDLVDSAEISEE